MELMTVILLVILLVIAFIAKNISSEISYIKFQNESIRRDLQELRGAIENRPVQPEQSAVAAPEEAEDGTDTPKETESIREVAAVMPPTPPASAFEPVVSDWEEETDINPETIADVLHEEETRPEKKPIRPEEEVRRPNNWEKFIGVNLFSKIGILVLIVGIGFFVKYAIDRDWINEATRTALGIGVGFTLWGIAYRIREQYRSFSSVLAGGGFAICFVCIAIAFHLYGLFSATATFVSLTALTVMTAAISLRFDRAELAIVSIVGGFAAPFIASDGSGSFLFVLGYMAVLNTAMFAVTLRKDWWSLPVISCILTYIICVVAEFSGNLKADSGIKFAVMVYYFILFSIPTVTALNRKRPERPAMTGWLMTAIVVNSVAFLYLGSCLVNRTPVLHHLKGLAAIIGALVSLTIYLKYYLRKDEGATASLLLTLIAGFSLAAFLMQFTKPGIYISAIGIEAAALSWLHSRTGRRIFRNLALVIGLPFTVILLTTFGLFGSSGDNNTAWGYIVTGTAYLWSAYMAFENRKTKEAGEWSILSTGALWAGGALLVCGGNLVFSHWLPDRASDGLTILLTASVMLAVIVLTKAYRLTSTYLIFPGLAALILADFGTSAIGTTVSNISLTLAIAVFAAVYLRCGTDMFRAAQTSFGPPPGYMIYFNISVCAFAVLAVVRLLEILWLPHLYSAGVSVALTGCAAAQMVIGMKSHSKPLRIISLCVFGIVIAKLAVYDLWKMAAIGRIIVFILLGVILLAVSFLYQRLRGVLLDDDKEPDPTGRGTE